MQVVVGGETGHRAERRLPALPQQLALGLVGRDAHRARAVGLADLVHQGGRVIDERGQPVDFDEQHRGGVDGIARVHEVLDRRDHPARHHLEGGRHETAGDDRAHAGGGIVD